MSRVFCDSVLDIYLPRLVHCVPMWPEPQWPEPARGHNVSPYCWQRWGSPHRDADKSSCYQWWCCYPPQDKLSTEYSHQDPNPQICGQLITLVIMLAASAHALTTYCIQRFDILCFVFYYPVLSWCDTLMTYITSCLPQRQLAVTLH